MPTGSFGKLDRDVRVESLQSRKYSMLSETEQMLKELSEKSSFYVNSGWVRLGSVRFG